MSKEGSGELTTDRQDRYSLDVFALLQRSAVQSPLPSVHTSVVVSLGKTLNPPCPVSVCTLVYEREGMGERFLDVKMF